MSYFKQIPSEWNLPSCQVHKVRNYTRTRWYVKSHAWTREFWQNNATWQCPQMGAIQMIITTGQLGWGRHWLRAWGSQIIYFRKPAPKWPKIYCYSTPRLFPQLWLSSSQFGSSKAIRVLCIKFEQVAAAGSTFTSSSRCFDRLLNEIWMNLERGTGRTWRSTLG